MEETWVAWTVRLLIAAPLYMLVGWIVTIAYVYSNRHSSRNAVDDAFIVWLLWPLAVLAAAFTWTVALFSRTIEVTSLNIAQWLARKACATLGHKWVAHPRAYTTACLWKCSRCQDKTFTKNEDTPPDAKERLGL